ncbi:MAG: helix-turn-helix transcriptional regulator [Chloroflexi bacterium]|nr:helix-turn-helix transcriptional regulator [Chloroflexota bacterium]
MAIKEEKYTSQRVLARPPEVDNYVKQFLTAACDTSRRYILELLATAREADAPAPYELSAGAIAQRLCLAPSTTSEHLRHLEKAHLVVPRRDGNKIYYRLRNHDLQQAFRELIRALETHYQTHSSISRDELENKGE